ncbi:RHS repeat domain-containing protein [Costertonia aggregata]|uniref:RHS repeat protein n=1 Tax=Costertonia aggregata TaxID=343403 RepID=A0A7H9ATH5_9FLAO|nr:hypothetical protein [Costertonia aggregata]QLG46778.1 hypothetical protein HYG79_15940 [Costertonia aggregata]
MIKTKFSHKVMSIFLTFTFLPSLLPINYIYASNNGPTAPEAASFEPVDAPDMVNLATGDLSYVLPLLNVPSPEGGYPLALSYHAGIGVDQEASWVGLGWNLNPGAINRNVSGVPDDWLGKKKYSMMYNDIGVAKSISLTGGLDYGAISFAASLNYSSYKATGGETAHDFGVGVSASFFGNGNNSGLGVGSYLGTNGFGINAGYLMKDGAGGNAGVGLSTFQSFNGEGFSIGAYSSIGGASASINLSSRGPSASINGLGRNISLAGGDNLNSVVHQQKSSFYLNFFVGSFSYGKTNYWAFDANYSSYNGSLYAGKVNETYQNTVDPLKFGIDAYEATYDADRTDQYRDVNFSFISYDKYNINAQGIGGSISPKLLENGALIMPIKTLRTRTSLSGAYQTPSTNITYLKPQANSRNFSKSLDQKDVHFYFDNEYSSYLDISSGNWSVPFNSNTYDDLTNISLISKTFTDNKELNGELFDSYNEANGRLKKGNYIETFTNEEINESPSKIIQPEATGFSRTNQFVPKKGIGAFRVTALDGKTYHYSLPVYHKEQFSRASNVEDDSEDKFFEQQQFEPYATHWLLTAVTGSDYFDKNQNNRVDKGDFGYWTSFEYGKWSDGFAWRSPKNGTQSNGIINSYSWGIKEVYYLDKIKTRTHTALFIKELREDNRSYSGRISDGNNPKHYKLPFERGILQSTDGNYYSQGTHLDIPVYSYPPWNFHSISDFWIYADLAEQKSLRLNKIILLKNEDAENVQKHNSIDTSSIYAGRTFSDAKISLIETASGRFIKDEESAVNEDHTWYGEFYDYVLNNQDLDLTTLIDKSIKTVDFNYDENYPLSRYVSNPKGKLTLNSVRFIGKQGTQLIPPYKFQYYSPSTTFTENDIDDWGYFKNNAMMWSLNKITNPLGGALEIIYENDRYVNEYASPTTFFDSGLEFKYRGTILGPKTVSFRNDADVDAKYHVDFTEYFTAGQLAEIDVQFWHFTQTNSNWIADVAASCIVQEVSNNLIIFSLPNNTNQSWGREFSNCKKKDWIYWDGEYNHVVDLTAGWSKRNNYNSCERPEERTNRSRYQLLAQKEPLSNSFGGGVRVKELKVKGDSHTTKTSYSYKNSDGEETGVTSYAVSKRERIVPYITELPSPMVLYQNVTTERRDTNDNSLFKKIYHFEVPKPIQYLPNGVLVENVLEVQLEQNDTYYDISVNNEDVDVVLSKFKLLDYSANVGRLKSTEEYNPEGQLVRKIKNSYLPKDYNHDQGILKETFSSYKLLRDSPLKDKFFMTSSSKTKVPNILSKISIVSNGFTKEQETKGYDFFTGQVKESSSLLSDGRLFKTKHTPAYEIYAKMGSKVDNPSNSNMLVQRALSVSEIQKDGLWHKISSNIKTWKPEEYRYTTYVGDPINTVPLTQYKDIWRASKNYVWNGNTDTNGFFTTYSGEDDGFDWITDNNSDSEWKLISEISRYSAFSIPLEILDVNRNKISTKIGYNDTKTISTCNAGYQESFYSGAEDLDVNVFGGHVQLGSAITSNTNKHTGNYSLRIASGETGYVVNVEEGRKDDYKVSLWAKFDGHQYVRLNVGGTLVSPNSDEIVRAGDWAQLNFYFKINGTQTVSVTSSGGVAFVDDFRLHPVASTMTSYVYNQWDELTDILGGNNLGTHYEYDQAGRLIRTFTEVVDFNGDASGGFKKVSENRYSYKTGTN